MAKFSIPSQIPTNVPPTGLTEANVVIIVVDQPQKSAKAEVVNSGRNHISATGHGMICAG